MSNLWVQFTVTLDSGGNGTQEVGAPALGSNWQGFITVDPAPAGQTFKVLLGGAVVAAGGRTSSPFSAGSGQTVIVKVTGGTAGSTVSGVLQGSINQGNAAQPVLTGNGSLIEISGGNITLQASDVTISGGQGGVNVSTNSPPVALGTVTNSNSSAPSSAAYTLPPGTHAISITVLYELNGVLQVAPANIRVNGATSGDALFDFSPSGGFPKEVYYMLVASATDTDVNVHVTTSVDGSDASVAFAAILDTEAVYAVNSPIQPLYTVGTQGASSASVQTVPEAPTGLYTGSVALAAGTTTLVSGVTGESIRVRTVSITPSGAVGNYYGTIQSSSGKAVLFYNVNPQAPMFMDYQGYALPSGDSLDLVVASAGADSGAYFNMAITYDQYL